MQQVQTINQTTGIDNCSAPQRAMCRMIKEANSLGLTVRFDPIEAA
ncbi:hypothetical protein [Streptomyces sp. CT34]|nr:hypothetical protein [Streptomyces sp. CT34]